MALKVSRKATTEAIGVNLAKKGKYFVIDRVEKGGMKWLGYSDGPYTKIFAFQAWGPSTTSARTTAC